MRSPSRWSASTNAAHVWGPQIPSTTSPCDEETGEKVLRLLDALEELDDVQDVHSNADIPDSVVAGA